MSEIKIAIVTGAGSGVGRAVAHSLWQQGYHVALLGRRINALEETVQTYGLPLNDRALVLQCDVSNRDAAQAAIARVLTQWGHADVLINSAGTNIPKRSLKELSDAHYQELIDANMNGAYWCVQGVLPDMRARGQGTIVNIGSVAGLKASPLAGAAYAMSKFGMTALNQAINAEERGNGIRAVLIAPGDINTEILDKRPSPPPMEKRLQVLQPEDVAACVMLAINLPQRAIIEELILTPR